MANKLYPPIIEGTLPAFCKEYDSTNTILRGATLTVPFTMNEAVSEKEIAGFVLRLRTASSGSYIFEPQYSSSYNIATQVATFRFTPAQAEQLNEGQYYKVQIAYISTLSSSDNIGYFSTVGVAKCTSRPSVSINGLTAESVNFFTNTFIGVYDQENCRDQTEKVYSYEFLVYTQDKELYYTTGEKLHQVSYDTSYTFSVDKVTLNDFVSSSDNNYFIQYKVTTMNGLELSTPLYALTSGNLVSPNEPIEILPIADEDAGYITVTFKGAVDEEKSSYYLLKDSAAIDEYKDDELLVDAGGRTVTQMMKAVMSRGTSYYDNNYLCKLYVSINDQNELRAKAIAAEEPVPVMYTYAWRDKTLTNLTLKTVILENGTENRYYFDWDLENVALGKTTLDSLQYFVVYALGTDMCDIKTYKYVNDNNIDVEAVGVTKLGESIVEKNYYGNYILSRASNLDGYTTWFNISHFRLDNEPPSSFSLKDFTIEHGRKYKYGLQQVNLWNLTSERIMSEAFEANFEDMYLYDGEKMLKLRYNPEISSFKTTVLEQKTDTLGSKYPYITRNGTTYYKEFPISGLLTHNLDTYNCFVTKEYPKIRRTNTGYEERYFKGYAIECVVVNDDHAIDGRYLVEYQGETFTATSTDKLYSVGDAIYVQSQSKVILDKRVEKEDITDYSKIYTDENIFLEREFKTNVLDWLNNGQPKLFKSPYEGNFIVRLLNNSLTPVKELGRLLHSFQSQAYEVAEFNYDNLIAFGFLSIDSPSDYTGMWRTYDLLDPTLRNDDGDIELVFEAGLQNFTVQDMMPGDILHIWYTDSIAYETIMIGATGSYTYDNADREVNKILIKPKGDIGALSERYKSGTINCCYQGVHISVFDSIINQQLKTLPCLQYVGVNPAIKELRKAMWEGNEGDTGVNSFSLSQENFYNLQEYNIRDIIEDSVTLNSSTNGINNYTISEEFKKYIKSFDPGELLTRINATINKGQAFKIELINLDFGHFRLRELVPVYAVAYDRDDIEHNYPIGTDSPTGSIDVDGEKIIDTKATQHVYVALSPYESPMPIEDLQSYTMLDPFSIYQIYELRNGIWQLRDLATEQQTYYDPYYRTWIKDYDTTVKINYKWRRVINIVDKSNSDGYYLCTCTYTDEDNNILIKDIKVKDRYEIFEKINNEYIAIINSSPWYDYETREYYIKDYDTVYDLSFTKEKTFSNLSDINSIVIGTGVIAELTCQIKVMDYYTEIYNPDVAQAKAEYIALKQFYNNLMGDYASIAEADYFHQKYGALSKAYEKMINGTNKSFLSSDDCKVLKALLNNSYEADLLNPLRLYKVEVLNNDTSDTQLYSALKEYKQNHIDDTNYGFEDGNTGVYQQIDQYSLETYSYIINENDITNIIVTFPQGKNSISWTGPEMTIIAGYTNRDKDKFDDYNVNGEEDSIFYYRIEDKNGPDKKLTFNNVPIELSAEQTSVFNTPVYVNTTQIYRQEDNDKTVKYYRVDQQKMLKLFEITNPEIVAIPNRMKIKYDADGYNENNVSEDYLFNESLTYQFLTIQEIALNEKITPIVYKYKLFNDDEIIIFRNSEDYISDNLVEFQNKEDLSFFEEKVLEQLAMTYDVEEIEELEGVQPKLTDIEAEIKTLRESIDNLEIQYEFEKQEYLDIYSDLKKAFNEYNEKVYKNWSYNEIINLLNKGYTKKYIANSFETLLKILTENFDNIQSLMERCNGAMTQLYYQINEDLPKVVRYNQMIEDSRDENNPDYKLDKYLREQIQEKYGYIMMALLAFENLLVKTVDYIDAETDPYIKNNYIEQWETSFNRYNEMLATIQFFPEDWIYYILMDNNKPIEEQDCYVKTLIDRLVNQLTKIDSVEEAQGNIDDLVEVAITWEDLLFLVHYGYLHEELDQYYITKLDTIKNNSEFLQNKNYNISCYIHKQILKVGQNKYIDIRNIERHIHTNEGNIDIGNDKIIIQMFKYLYEKLEIYNEIVNEIPKNGDILNNFDPWQRYINTLSEVEKRSIRNHEDFKYNIFYYRYIEAYRDISTSTDVDIDTQFIFNPLDNKESRTKQFSVPLPNGTSAIYTKTHYDYYTSSLLKQKQRQQILELATQYLIPNIIKFLENYNDDDIDLKNKIINEINTKWLNEGMQYNKKVLQEERDKLLNGDGETKSAFKQFNELSATAQRDLNFHLYNQYNSEEHPIYTLEFPTISRWFLQVNAIDKPPFIISSDQYNSNKKYFKDKNGKQEIVFSNSNEYEPNKYYIINPAAIIQSAYLDEEILHMLGEPIEILDYELNEESLFQQYLENVILTPKNEKEQLLQEAIDLRDLYDEQNTNYKTKYSEYLSEYNKYLQIWNEYLTDEEKRKLLEFYQGKGKTLDDYRMDVKKAWWKFLNLLDAKYTQEKERGMYK